MEGATTLSKVVSMRVWGNLIIAHYIGGSGCGILGEVVAYNSDAEQIINYGSYEFQQDVDPNNPASAIMILRLMMRKRN